MTEVNGLRLAYRGFVTGLAAAYVWLALAMSASAVVRDDPLLTLRPIASSLVPRAGGSAELAFVLGFGMVQLAGAMVGMVFAYFFARFFTVRYMLAVATACFAGLTWVLLASALDRFGGPGVIGFGAAPLVASLAYGLVLGTGLPVRPDVLRVEPLV